MKEGIRLGEERDIPDLLRLIKDLALYEKAADEVINTEAKLLADWKGDWFEFLVAEHESKVVGISLYYKRYSTWKGCCFYLEDLYVQPEMRGKGYGLALLQETAKIAKRAGADRLDWQVIDWNSPAVEFYEKLGAHIEKVWWNCKLDLRESE